MHCVFGQSFCYCLVIDILSNLLILPQNAESIERLKLQISNDSRMRTGNKKTHQKAIPSILIPEWFPKTYYCNIDKADYNAMRMSRRYYKTRLMPVIVAE